MEGVHKGAAKVQAFSSAASRCTHSRAFRHDAASASAPARKRAPIPKRCSVTYRATSTLYAQTHAQIHRQTDTDTQTDGQIHRQTDQQTGCQMTDKHLLLLLLLLLLHLLLDRVRHLTATVNTRVFLTQSLWQMKRELASAVHTSAKAR